MAKDKKAVLLYCDLIHTVEKMDNETAGLFFKHYLRYVNDLDPTTDNLLVEITFESVKQNLKRDLKKWEERAERSRENGAKGGRPTKPKETQKTQRVISKPRKPDTVTVTVKDTVTVNVNDIKERKAEFKNSLLPFLEEVGSSDLNDFFEYWTEHGIKDRKMRFEKQTSFSIERRLKTWLRRKTEFAPKEGNLKQSLLSINEKLKAKHGAVN